MQTLKDVLYQAAGNVIITTKSCLFAISNYLPTIVFVI